MDLGGVTVQQALLGITYFSKGLKGIPMSYLDFLEVIAEEDVAGLKKAEESYGDSWKKRGGVGAFMMLARKWDRIEKQVSHRDTGALDAKFPGDRWNIFAHVEADDRPEGLIDDIRDLRRYLMLVEGELRARKTNG